MKLINLQDCRSERDDEVHQNSDQHCPADDVQDDEENDEDGAADDDEAETTEYAVELMMTIKCNERHSD